ncbi:hypothetical protein BKA93DRAFT_827684 [Sparassis latifolia]
MSLFIREGPADDAPSSANSTVTGSGTSALTIVPSSLPATAVTEPSTALPTRFSGNYSSAASTTNFQTQPSGTSDVVTVTVIPTAQSVTVVMVSVETVISTVTAPGSTVAYTTTQEETLWSTVDVSSTQQPASSLPAGYLPVDAADHSLPRSSVFLSIMLCAAPALAMIIY